MRGDIIKGSCRALSLLASVLLSVGMTGCGDKPVPEAEAGTDAASSSIMRTEQEAAERVELRYVGCRFDERQALEVLWVNPTEREVCWGEPYTLYRQEADGWKAVSGEGIFPAIGYILRPGQESTHTYDLTVYGPLYPGIYRVETDYFFDDAERPITEADQCPISVTFPVGRPTEGTYWFDRSLLVNPLSSFLPNARNMPEYHIRDGVLSAMDSSGNEKLLGELRPKPLIDPEKSRDTSEETAAYAGYPIAEHVLGCEVPIEKPGDCFLYETEADGAGAFYRLYDVSGTLWLAQMQGEEAWMVVSLRAAGLK